MQYGAIAYKKTLNLGDDIQTYAATRFYPHVDYYIEREKIDSFYSENGEKVATIMAGWYTHSPLNWPPSPYIHPLMVSMHFTQHMICEIGKEKVNTLDNQCCRDWFRKSGKIGVGCRDSFTQYMLQKVGIKTWWSGCITLTLQKYKNVPRHEKIVCVDIAPEVVEIIRKNTKREVVNLSHRYEEVEDVETRMEKVEERLKFYQGASLMVTGRLHAALPANALEVPTLLVVNENTDYRFENYIQYLNCIDEQEILEERFSYDFNCPKENKKELLKLGKSLSKVCEEFVFQCEEMEYIPTINFEEFYESVNRMERLKQLIYAETNSWYLKGYSQKETDHFITFHGGMKAYETGNWNEALDLFRKSFRNVAGENENTQINILTMYLKTLLKLGAKQEAKSICKEIEEMYGHLKEYQMIYQEVFAE